jgi:uncharacterized protein YdhG (YjbR/CyaY superfamily)
MKKTKSTKRASEAKRPTTKKPSTIDEYLAGVPEPARSTLNTVRAAVRSASPPDATETISYGIPAFRHKEVLVWFAAFANHCSFFPTAAVIETFKSDLKGCVLSKGTIQFPTSRPLSAALIKKMVKARLAQIQSKNR